MEIEAINEELIVRYLLGDLPEEEQVRIEDRAFTDREYTRAIATVENDLIDEYARGELSDADSRRFERRFLVSAERQKKVEFARAMATLVPAVSTAAAPQPAAEQVMDLAPTSWWKSLQTSLNSLNLSFKISIGAGAAAAAMLVIGVSWLVTETVRLRAQIAQLQADRQTRQSQEDRLRQQATAERSRSEDLASQLQRERGLRERSEELARQLERDRARDGSNALSFIASVFLAPGLPRGGGNRPKLLIPQTAQPVRLQIGLEREDDYKSFRVELRTAQGQEVWTRDNLHPRQSRAGRVLNLVIPGNVLGAGEYELTLKGVIDQQKTEEVRYYYFDALKK